MLCRPGGLGLFEFAQGFLLVGLETGDTAGLLEDLTSVLRAGTQHLVDTPLFHQGVGGGPDTGVHEQPGDVLQAAGGLVQEVLAFARAEDAAGDGDFIVVGAEGFLAIGEGDADFRHPEGLAGVGAVEDDIFHFAAAQGLGAGLAEYPSDGIGDIAFSAPVRSDDGSHAGLKG